MKHELKVLSPFFEAIIAGNKKSEVRNNADRGFQKGDTVILTEVCKSGIGVRYCGRSQKVKITYVSDYGQPSNQVVFSFELMGEPQSE